MLFKPYFRTILKFLLLIIFVKIISKAIFLHNFNVKLKNKLRT